MIQKLESSIKSDLRRAAFMADTYVSFEERQYHTACYFRSRKNRKLAYVLHVRRDVFDLPGGKRVLIAQKGVLQGSRNRTMTWKWTNLTAPWKKEALLLIAWPDWSPDDYMG